MPNWYITTKQTTPKYKILQERKHLVLLLSLVLPFPDYELTFVLLDQIPIMLLA